MRWLWQKSRDWTPLSFLLRERLALVILLVVAGLYLALSLFEVALWQCPWRELTGRRCLGCGLTTGCKAFLRGNFGSGMAWNWLTPFVMAALIFLPLYLALPGKAKESLLNRVEKLEREWRLVLWLGLFLFFFVVARVSGWA
jgi:hypothetical protein